jgi:hypothetical protein
MHKTALPGAAGFYITTMAPGAGYLTLLRGHGLNEFPVLSSRFSVLNAEDEKTTSLFQGGHAFQN